MTDITAAGVFSLGNRSQPFGLRRDAARRAWRVRPAEGSRRGTRRAARGGGERKRTSGVNSNSFWASDTTVVDCVQSGEGLVRQREFGRRRILMQVGDRRRAGDQENVGCARQQPGSMLSGAQ